MRTRAAFYESKPKRQRCCAQVKEDLRDAHIAVPINGSPQIPLPTTDPYKDLVVVALLNVTMPRPLIDRVQGRRVNMELRQL